MKRDSLLEEEINLVRHYNPIVFMVYHRYAFLALSYMVNNILEECLTMPSVEAQNFFVGHVSLCEWSERALVCLEGMLSRKLHTRPIGSPNG